MRQTTHTTIPSLGRVIGDPAALMLLGSSARPCRRVLAHVRTGRRVVVEIDEQLVAHVSALGVAS